MATRWIVRLAYALGVLSIVADGLVSISQPQRGLLAYLRGLLAYLVDVEMEATHEHLRALQTKEKLLMQLLQVQRDLESAQPTGNGSTPAPFRRSLPPAVRRLVARPNDRKTRVQFDEWLPPVATWTQREVASSDDPTLPQLQVVVTLNKQTQDLRFYHPVSTALLYQLHLNVPAKIDKVVIHSDRSTRLIVTSELGDLMMYRLRVYHGRRLAAGEYRRVYDRDPHQCIARHSTVNPSTYACAAPGRQWGDIFLKETWRVTPPVGHHVQLELEPMFHVVSPLMIDQLAVMQHYTSVYVVGSDSAGKLIVLDGNNGQLVKELTPEPLGRITGFASLTSGVLAFATGTRVRFLSVWEKAMLPLVCEGSTHTISSLDRDSSRSSVLIAGTQDGSGLVFRLDRLGDLKRTPSEANEQGVPTCTLIAQLTSRQAHLSRPRSALGVGPALVKGLPGFILLSTPARVVLFAASTLPPTYLTEKHLASLNGSLLLAHAWHHHHRVELLAARAASPASSIELGWIRAPVVLLCAIGVMFWQQNKYRRGPPPSFLDAGLSNDHFQRSDWASFRDAVSARSRRDI
ncbi:hypothetical protein ATCC90586_008293 [Pythium insidiosum]|nr:hypothetical protein ATCC90586_008293 [Pythium insidiosum]